MKTDETGYELAVPFWIDDDHLTERDRQMFCLGAEFAIVMQHVRFRAGPLSTVIHRENEFRVRTLCERFARPYKVQPCDSDDNWSHLDIQLR